MPILSGINLVGINKDILFNGEDKHGALSYPRFGMDVPFQLFNQHFHGVKAKAVAFFVEPV